MYMRAKILANVQIPKFVVNFAKMVSPKKILFSAFLLIMLSWSKDLSAQCSICAKTAEQMGEKPAKGFNSGIIYLMLTPFAVMGYLGYRWYQGNKNS